MGTRSRIGLQLDGGIVSVYCHWDGYPEYNGVILEHLFKDKNSISELIDGGDISSCDSDTDWNLEKVDNHVQYYNDRGEKPEPRLDLNQEDFFANGEEYAYIFEPNGKWVCYDLHYPKPQLTSIPPNFPKELAQ